MPYRLFSLLVAATLLAQVYLPVAELPHTPPRRPEPAPAATPDGPNIGKDKSKSKARKRWFEEMHGAPSGTSWRTIERRNGDAQAARRRGGVRPPDDGAVWVERGSVNVAGRIHLGRLSPDGQRLYAGSDRGGVWRGLPDGSGWTPIGDNLYGGAQWLEVLPGPDGDTSVDTVLAGTNSGGLSRTTTDGQRWDLPAGLPPLSEIRRLITSSDGSYTVYLLGRGPGGYSLFRSDDLGASFVTLASFGGYGADLWTGRTGDPTLYLLYDDHVAVSTDRGDTWTDHPPFTNGESSGDLVGSEAGAPHLYALTGGSLWRSDDAGASFTELGRASDYYRGALGASSQNPDLVTYGGVELWVSRNGGRQFDRVNRWDEYYNNNHLLHADLWRMEITVGQDGVEQWWLGTDGGLYTSTDGLRSTRNLSLDGLRVSQYYDTHTSRANPDQVAAGAQDQGYQTTAGQDNTSRDIYAFEQVISGDYGHLTSSDGTHARVFAVYPGYLVVAEGEDNPRLSWGYFPDRENYVAWMPPIVADPYDDAAVFFPATRLYRYTFNGREWTPDRWSEQRFDTNGGYLSAVGFSPADPERAYAATSRGELWWSDDHGETWERSDDEVAPGNWYYGQALGLDRADPDRVLVAGSGYDGDVVWRSDDGGRRFEPWSEGLPPTLGYCLTQANDDVGTWFLGTETAAYRRGPDDPAWIDITTERSPLTTWWSCETLPTGNTVRFGTYGRGIWDYEMPVSDCMFGGDNDGDGDDCTSDCDDADPSRYTGAADPCDSVDQDCDPSTSPIADADADGALACDDCDDADPDQADDCAPAGPQRSAASGTYTGGCDTGATDVASPAFIGLIGLLLRRRRSPSPGPLRQA